MTHSQEIQDLIVAAMHAPATGSIVIQGALFLDIISRLENAEQQNVELKEQSSRLASEAVRQAQQNADLCVKNAELLESMLSVRGILETYPDKMLCNGEADAIIAFCKLIDTVEK